MLALESQCIPIVLVVAMFRNYAYWLKNKQEYIDRVRVKNHIIKTFQVRLHGNSTRTVYILLSYRVEAMVKFDYLNLALWVKIWPYSKYTIGCLDPAHSEGVVLGVTLKHKGLTISKIVTQFRIGFLSQLPICMQF